MNKAELLLGNGHCKPEIKVFSLLKGMKFQDGCYKTHNAKHNDRHCKGGIVNGIADVIGVADVLFCLISYCEDKAYKTAYCGHYYKRKKVLAQMLF